MQSTEGTLKERSPIEPQRLIFENCQVDVYQTENNQPASMSQYQNPTQPFFVVMPQNPYQSMNMNPMSAPWMYNQGYPSMGFNQPSMMFGQQPQFTGYNQPGMQHNQIIAYATALNEMVKVLDRVITKLENKFGVTHQADAQYDELDPINELEPINELYAPKDDIIRTWNEPLDEQPMFQHLQENGVGFWKRKLTLTDSYNVDVIATYKKSIKAMKANREFKAAWKTPMRPMLEHYWMERTKLELAEKRSIKKGEKTNIYLDYMDRFSSISPEQDQVFFPENS
jgi:hypothetical protein